MHSLSSIAGIFYGSESVGLAASPVNDCPRPPSIETDPAELIENEIGDLSQAILAEGVGECYTVRRMRFMSNGIPFHQQF